MKLVQGIAVVFAGVLLASCVTTTTTVKKPVDAAVPVEGLNVLYVNAPMTARGNTTGYTPGTVTVDTNQLAGAVERGLPKIFETKTIPVSTAIADLPRGNRSPINVNTQFPLTAKTHHLLVVTPVAARETCKMHPGGYPYDCATRLTVTARLLAPGSLSTLWESQLQEARVLKCANCAQRFEGFAEDIADEVMKVVVKRPAELSQGLAGQIKLDESRPLLDLRQQPDGVTPILGAQPKK